MWILGFQMAPHLGSEHTWIPGASLTHSPWSPCLESSNTDCARILEFQKHHHRTRLRCLKVVTCPGPAPRPRPENSGKESEFIWNWPKKPVRNKQPVLSCFVHKGPERENTKGDFLRWWLFWDGGDLSHGKGFFGLATGGPLWEEPGAPNCTASK